ARTGGPRSRRPSARRGRLPLHRTTSHRHERNERYAQRPTYPGRMPVLLDAAEWRARRAAHEARVDTWLAPHLARRRAGQKHPVEYFLFTYYSSRPAQLRRWHPGAGVVLADAELDKGYVRTGDGVMLDPTLATASRDWIRTLLANTAGRVAHFGCFGMHEWAM